MRQADAQLALAEEKLTRSRILAPFDGIVVSGDLSQMLGSPVEKGKTLFEIAPLNSYRLIVQVDERDVRYIAVGQGGTVALAGRPGEPVADDPEQDHARHGRRGRAQFLSGRGSPDRNPACTCDRGWKASPRSNPVDARLCGFGCTLLSIGCVLPRGSTYRESVRHDAPPRS